jgi:hypothetical protein
LEKVES